MLAALCSWSSLRKGTPVVLAAAAAALACGAASAQKHDMPGMSPLPADAAQPPVSPVPSTPAGPPPPAMGAMPGMTMPAPAEIVFVCPLKRSIRSLEPGECTSGGETAELVAEVPEPVEFPMELTTSPARLAAGQPAELDFVVRDPWDGEVVDRFAVVHEALLHLFVVSADLEYFAHVHPQLDNGRFRLATEFPREGSYRVLADFWPQAATSQLLARTLFVGDAAMRPPALRRDYSLKQTENLAVELASTPAEPVAGSAATLRFRLDPVDGLEPYLGALGHMLIASDDLVDLIHAHPSTLGFGGDVEFSVVFPRPRAYRVWVQFQRNGVVSTAHFDVIVGPPVRPDP
jgi:hypothetical protein